MSHYTCVSIHSKLRNSLHRCRADLGRGSLNHAIGATALAPISILGCAEKSAQCESMSALETLPGDAAHARQSLGPSWMPCILRNYIDHVIKQSLISCRRCSWRRLVGCQVSIEGMADVALTVATKGLFVDR